MKSPVTKSAHVVKLSEMDVKPIIEKYQHRFQVDVSRYFVGLEKLEEWMCNDTGYRFYHPFSVSGDHYLYEQLQMKEWYYMPWKWEHENAIALISENMNVLEIGCGKGTFLEAVIDRGAKATGLEQNKRVVNQFHNEKPRILNQTIEEHARENKNSYDVVCLFQVLEHIYDVNSFLEDVLICLKSKGLLIISVPNNDSFIKIDREDVILNLPPHHMGLWNKKSLFSLTKYFDIELIQTMFEPLQDYHFKWYQHIMEKSLSKNKLLQKLYLRLKISDLYKFYIRKNSSNIKGHTVLAVYKKI